MVLAAFWIAASAIRSDPRAQARLALGAGLWLTVIYAVHHGRWTFEIAPLPWELFTF